MCPQSCRWRPEELAITGLVQPSLCNTSAASCISRFGTSPKVGTSHNLFIHDYTRPI